MASDLDVEFQPYEEVIGNLDFSTPVGSRSSSPYRISITSFQEPTHQIEVISPCATTYPRLDPVDCHALIPQVSCISSSRHTNLKVKVTRSLLVAVQFTTCRGRCILWRPQSALLAACLLWWVQL